MLLINILNHPVRPLFYAKHKCIPPASTSLHDTTPTHFISSCNTLFPTFPTLQFAPFLYCNTFWSNYLSFSYYTTHKYQNRADALTFPYNIRTNFKANMYVLIPGTKNQLCFNIHTNTKNDYQVVPILRKLIFSKPIAKSTFSENEINSCFSENKSNYVLKTSPILTNSKSPSFSQYKRALNTPLKTNFRNQYLYYQQTYIMLFSQKIQNIDNHQ